MQHLQRKEEVVRWTDGRSLLWSCLLYELLAQLSGGTTQDGNSKMSSMQAGSQARYSCLWLVSRLGLV